MICDHHALTLGSDRKRKRNKKRKSKENVNKIKSTIYNSDR